MESPHQGEILLLLSNRTKKRKEEIAKGLNIHPAHLSKLFRSEFLSAKIKREASTYFGVEQSIFEDGGILASVVNEPNVEYEKPIEQMTAVEVLRYLEEKDKRHYQERIRLLAIIENLTKP